MTEKTEENGLEKETGREEDAGQEPKIYDVKKELSGWTFGRREFLTATAAAAAAAAAAGAGAIGKSKQGASEAWDGSKGTIALAVAMPAMMAVRPDQPFVQAWRFTNKSRTAWCKASSLHLATDEQMEAPASVSVPEIAPGQTVDIKADMVAPAKSGIYRSSGRLQIAGITTPVDVGPMIVQNGCIIESNHFYENNASEAWTVTNPHENAQHTRVHFSRVDVRSGDTLILKDSKDQEYQRITGNYPSGLWSELIPGREVNVELVTDASGTGWGFCLDQVESEYMVYLPLISRQPTPTPSPTPTPRPCLAESQHPYKNNVNYTWTVTNPDPGAGGSRVHFSRVEMESGYDYLVIRDGAGREYQRITGSYSSGLWAEPVAGREVRIQILTDGNVTRWGFCVDKVETAAAPPTPTPTATPCGCDGVCSCDDHCSCDPYCTCDTVHYWYPN